MIYRTGEEQPVGTPELQQEVDATVAVMKQGCEQIELLEQTLDQRDARVADLEVELREIRRQIAAFTEGDQNPHRGMLYKLDRIAARALS